MSFTEAQFRTFFATQRGKALLPKDLYLSLIQQRSYATTWLLKGREKDLMAEMGGPNFIMSLSAGYGVAGGAINPGQKRSPNISSDQRNRVLAPRFYESHVGWTEQEIMLAQGADAEAIVRYADVVEGNRLLKCLDTIEDVWFKRPDSSLMENPDPASNTAPLAYSIPAILTESANGLPPAYTTATGPVWNAATVGGYDPTLLPDDKPQRATYDSAAWNNEETGILPAFDLMLENMTYEPFSLAAKAVKPSDMSTVTVFTNTDGRVKLTSLYRGKQDMWEDPNDANQGMPKIGGASIVKISKLDKEYLDQNNGGPGGAAQYTEQPYPKDKPRFFFWNNAFGGPRFKGSKNDLFKAKAPKDGGIEYPDTTVVYTRFIMQLVWSLRNRHGIVCPQ
ncbi:hypothetical protein [Tolypothrix sp. VBCCA 56010]|uniref:hypothetical protein n=1 Tax=Tolypothrix sp. VBCCA 56010 TaxID=3137731 RepID=UPI003D7C962C